MTFFGRRRAHDAALEDELRKLRPQPRGEFLTTLVADIDNLVRRPRLRNALAVSFSAGLLVILAAFGGVGYAASQTHHFVQIAVGKSHRSAYVSAADDQYRPGKGCGDKKHTHVPKPGQKPCPPKNH